MEKTNEKYNLKKQLKSEKNTERMGAFSKIATVDRLTFNAVKPTKKK